MSLFNRKQFELPVGKPVRIRWILPPNWNLKTIDQFLEPAIKIVGRPEWSHVERDDGSEYICVDVADVSFPGFLAGDRLDDGPPALNEYVVTLNAREALLMGALLRLLSVYGAKVLWEVSSEIQIVSPSPSS